MKTFKFLMLAFFVSWQLQFQSKGKMINTERIKEFSTRQQAKDFMATQPFNYQPFRCVDSVSLKPGKCAIHDVVLGARP